ncbi:MAG TPA: membrane dipeptidase [Nitriliruptorales bacterium]
MNDGYEFGSFDFGLSTEQEERAARLHRDSIVTDVLFWGPVAYRSFTDDMDKMIQTAVEGAGGDPYAAVGYAAQLPGRLAARGEFDEYRQAWDDSGITVGHYPLRIGSERGLLEAAAYLTLLLDHLPWLTKALTADDIRRTKQQGGHAFFCQCQPSAPISRDVSLIERGHDLGLRMLQLTYNNQDHVGAGCTEPTDAGLSGFGRQVVGLLNELGIIVDTGHCGKQTTLDACRHSTAPVVASHTAAAAVHAHDRGKSDDELRAIADTGGFIGIVTVPFFLGDGPDVSMEAMLDHIDHVADLVGWEHVAIGTDWPLAGPKWVMEELGRWALKQGFRAEHNINAVQNLVGFDDYRDFPNITRGLVGRGYSDEQVTGILGGNFLRVFEQVCG